MKTTGLSRLTRRNYSSYICSSTALIIGQNIFKSNLSFTFQRIYQSASASSHQLLDVTVHILFLTRGVSKQNCQMCLLEEHRFMRNTVGKGFLFIGTLNHKQDIMLTTGIHLKDDITDVTAVNGNAFSRRIQPVKLASLVCVWWYQWSGTVRVSPCVSPYLCDSSVTATMAGLSSQLG